MAAMTESQGAIRAVSDPEILDAYRWLAANEGVFCEPASAAGVAGLLALRRGGREPDRLRAHRPRAQGPAGGARPRGLRRPLRAGHRRGRTGRAGVVKRRRRVRVPASSANLGPGFDVLAAALAMHLDIEVVETGRFRVHTELSIARDRRNLVVRGFARLHPRRRLRVPHRLRRPALGRPRHERGGLRRGPAGRGLDLRARRRHPRAGDRARGPSRQRRRGAAGRHRPLRRRRGDPLRPARRASRPCSSSPTARLRTAKARAALPAEVPMADAVFNVAHSSLLVLGLVQGRLDLVARGLADRLHQPHRTALYPESMALVERAREARRARAPRSRARARPCWCGACTTRRRASSSACARSPRAGRRCGGCRSSRRGRMCGRWTRAAGLNCALRRGCGVPRRAISAGCGGVDGNYSRQRSTPPREPPRHPWSFPSMRS